MPMDDLSKMKFIPITLVGTILACCQTTQSHDNNRQTISQFLSEAQINFEQARLLSPVFSDDREKYERLYRRPQDIQKSLTFLNNILSLSEPDNNQQRYAAGVIVLSFTRGFMELTLEANTKVGKLTLSFYIDEDRQGRPAIHLEITRTGQIAFREKHYIPNSLIDKANREIHSYMQEMSYNSELSLKEYVER